MASEVNPLLTIRSLHEAGRQIVQWLAWERESLELFHAYGQRWGGGGSNVYMLVLEDALRHRGLTLEQFKGQVIEG